MTGDVESSRQAWEQQNPSLPLPERIAAHRAWIAFWDHLASRRRNQKSPEAVAQVVDFLRREGILTADSRVLEIGAGSGDYSLALAGHCREVVALDMAAGPLACLRQRAEDLGLGNISCQLAAWEEYQADTSYDLVFAAMCPAICDADSLLAMAAASTRHCALVTVARRGGGSPDALGAWRAQLTKRLTDKPLPGLIPEAAYPLQYLEALGHNPGLWHFSYQSPAPAAGAVDAAFLEEWVETLRLYYRIFGLEGPEVTATIRAFLKERAEKEPFAPRESRSLDLALLYWRTTGERNE